MIGGFFDDLKLSFSKLLKLSFVFYTYLMQILAIETSCDETAVSLVKKERGGFFVADEYISSQTKTHALFGGVVPNLAAREHLKICRYFSKK